MSSLTSHPRVIAALIIREMSTRFGNKAGGYLWALFDPAAHVFMLTLIFQSIARIPPLGSSFPIFFASGYIALMFYTTIVNQINGAIQANRSLLQYPVVTPIDVVVARYLLQLMTIVLVGVIVFGALHIWTGEDLRWNLLPMIEAGFIGSMIALGVGMINIVLFRTFPTWEKIFGILTRPMFLISGVFFLPEAIPQPYRDVLLLNPIAHVIMWFRTGVFPYYPAPVLDREYVSIVAMVTVLVGLAVFTNARRGLRSA